MVRRHSAIAGQRPAAGQGADTRTGAGPLARADRRLVARAGHAGIVRRVSTRSAGLAVLIAITWGICFVVIQAALPDPAPLLMAALRALIGGGVLVAWIALPRRRPGRLRRDAGPAARQAGWSPLPMFPLLIALALTNAVLAFGAMYLAADRAEAGVASILAGGQPLILATAGWALFGERLSGRTVTGLAIAMAGVVVVATGSSGTTSLEGVALALLATAAPAAGTVLMRRLAPAVDLLATTSAQFLLGGAMLLAISAVLEPWERVDWSPAMLPGLLFLGVLGTGLAYVAWFWLLDRTGRARQMRKSLVLAMALGTPALGRPRERRDGP